MSEKLTVGDVLREIENQTIYTPTLREIKKYSEPTYWTVMKKLPELPFIEEESRGGKTGLIYKDRQRNYIWVLPGAVEEIRENNPRALLVLNTRPSNNSIKTIDQLVTADQRSLQEIIMRAKTLNQQKLPDEPPKTFIKAL